MSSDFWVTALLLLVILMITTASALMMGWSLRTGQFDNRRRDAASIFDADEPVGEPTDRVLR